MSVRAKNKKEALCWNKKQYNGNFEKNYNLTHQMNFDKYRMWSREVILFFMKLL